MGVVYLAEHLRLPRKVAIKALWSNSIDNEVLLDRFLVEMEAIAQLQHPNLVSAIDAGVVQAEDDLETELHYFVMDYIDGQGLDTLVQLEGALEQLRACDIIYQVASALTETHRKGLIHRDIKPSNILVTRDEQAKLLDFGLARHRDSALTEPGVILGTLDFLPPEQARDSHAVDHRADIFSLGATLYWCLTGQSPFSPKGSPELEITARMCQSAIPIREVCPALPEQLSLVVHRMLEISPEDRYDSANEVMQDLLPFLRAQANLSLRPTEVTQATRALKASASGRRALVIDDDENIRLLCQMTLQAHGFQCETAESGVQGLKILQGQAFDLVLLDVEMPGMTGSQVLEKIRQNPPCPHLKVVMISGIDSEDLSQLLALGADDYLPKPLKRAELISRAQAVLRLRESQVRADQLTQELMSTNRELELNLSTKDGNLIEARNALVLALAEMVSSRGMQSEHHLVRMQHYCRVLGEQASHFPRFHNKIDEAFLSLLECCAPLHDVGNVGLPDHILLAPGRLTDDERLLMQTHTLIGAETLGKVASRHGFSRGFFQMAVDIARHHHERYDGQGYPDGLQGDAIPLAARIVAIADCYDALRSKRPHKPALSHAVTLKMMTSSNHGQFDPHLLEALDKCSEEMSRVFRDQPD